MSRKAPKPPPEDASVVAARERSVLDLAKLDEEENRRIKQLRSASRGVRAFRAARGTAAGAGSVISLPSGAGSVAGSGGMPVGGYGGGAGDYSNWRDGG